MSRLATHVHVADESGTVHVFGPADEVPGWAARAITNPAAWAERPVADAVHTSAGDRAWPEGDPSEDWKLPELHAYVADKGIELGEARKKADILELIASAAAGDASNSEGAADDDSDNA